MHVAYLHTAYLPGFSALDVVCLPNLLFVASSKRLPSTVETRIS